MNQVLLVNPPPGIQCSPGATSFSVRARLVATGVVVPPRIAPILLSTLTGPENLSFVMNPNPPATSSSARGWYGVLWAVCALLMLTFSEEGNAFLARSGLRRARPPGPSQERAPVLLIIPALLVLAWATAALLGLQNDFEWVEEASAHVWDLRHSVRGKVASFTPETVASIDGREERDQGDSTYHIRFAFRSGDTRVMNTRSPTAFSELKKLAAAMELPRGQMHLKPVGEAAWTNGDFTLKAVTGTYEAANGHVLELRLDTSGRLTGTESHLDSAGTTLSHPLRAVKVTEDGSIEYRTGIFTTSAGNFAEGGLVVGGTRFKKSGK